MNVAMRQTRHALINAEAITEKINIVFKFDSSLLSDFGVLRDLRQVKVAW